MIAMFPVGIARMVDFLSEQLPDDEPAWPERVVAATQEGADLSGVWPAFAVRLLDRRLAALGDGLEPWRIQVRDAIEAVRDLHAVLAPRSDPRWSPAAAAADDAAKAAVEVDWSANAAAAAAGWAAAGWSSSTSMDWTSMAAGWAAGATHWDQGGKAAEIRRQADDLIELLAAAPIAEGGGA